MTRQNAINKMKDGNKVTHKLLGCDSYLYIVEGTIYDEANEPVGKLSDSYMMGRGSECWDEEWELYVA